MMATSAADGLAPVAVSVVVPVYKVANQLDACLASLVNQTIVSLEVLVVDDGSPDGSNAIGQRFADRYPHRFRLIRKINGGCASARSAGLAEARGEFVGFVDGDDWIEPDMFETLRREALLNVAEIAQCRYREVYPDGSASVPSAEMGLLAPDAERKVVTTPIELAAMRPSIWRRLYRRDFLQRHAISFPVHIRSFDDTAFQFETFFRADRVVMLPLVGYNYRQERAGQDTAARDEKLFAFFDIFRWLGTRLGSTTDPAAERQLLRVELNCHVWALERIQPRLRADYKQQALWQLGRSRRHLSPMQSVAVATGMYSKARTLMVVALLARAGRRPLTGQSV